MKNLLKNLCLIGFCSLQITQISAQETTRFTNEKGEKVVRVIFTTSKNKTMLQYKGDDLFNDDFVLGKFKVGGGKTIEAPIIYSIFGNEILVKIDNRTTYLKNANFSIGEHQFITLKKLIYEVLFDGEIKMLKQYNCHFHQFASQRFVTYNPDFVGEFISTEKYFFSLPNNKLVEFNLNKSSIAKVLQKDYPKIAEYILANATEINDEKTLENLLEKMQPELVN